MTLDTSVSGNTVYMEPKPVVDLNNAEALLAGQEQEEELAILADLSRQVSNYLCLLKGLSPDSRLSVPECTQIGPHKCHTAVAWAHLEVATLAGLSRRSAPHHAICH